MYSRLSSIDRSFLKGLEELPPLGVLSVAEGRARMRAGQATTAARYPVVIEQHAITACPVHLIRPLDAPASAPVLFYLHGGGWMLGDLETHMKLVCELAALAHCVIAFIEYPRAPENPFPVPLESSISAIVEILESSEKLGLDRSRFAIAGDSAGGNLAAAATLLAIERNLPLPVRQILLYPATDCNISTNSYHEFKDNPNLSRATMEWFWRHYLPNESHGTDPRVSLLQAEEQALAKFPPTMVLTCEYDVLRDEGEEFAARLNQAGVAVTAIRWLGALHGFLVTESLSSSPSAQTCMDLIAQYIRRGFEGE